MEVESLSASPLKPTFAEAVQEYRDSCARVERAKTEFNAACDAATAAAKTRDQLYETLQTARTACKHRKNAVLPALLREAPEPS